MAAPVAAQPHQDDWQMKALLSAKMVSAAADVGTSMYAFGQQGDRFREANPALRWVQDKPVAFSVVKMGLEVGVGLLAWELHKTHPRLAKCLLLGSTLGTVAIVASNARQLRD